MTKGLPKTRRRPTVQRGKSQRKERKLKKLDQEFTGVYKASALLTGPMELQQVLEIVVETIAQAVDAEAAGLRLLNKDTGQLILKATYGLSGEYISKGPVTAGESTLNQRALNGEVIVVEDMRTDEHFVKYHEEIKREGLVSCLTIGLMYKDIGIGILRLYNRKKRRFSSEAISTARIVASQSAAAITNARLYAEALEGERMARQIRLAGEVQRHLLPEKAPELNGMQLHGIYVPCYDVGGDFYDFIDIANDRWLVPLGDVMGKGVPASLVMASIRSALRAYAAQYEDLQRFVTRANRMFCHDSDLGEFATLFVAEVNPDESTLTYCNCGHDPPFIVRDKQIIELTQGGTVIGLDAESDYQVETVKMQKDDMLVMFTDGLADASNFDGDRFGYDRIMKAALDSAHLSAPEAAKNILWTMRKFAGLQTRGDDTALVVLKKVE